MTWLKETPSGGTHKCSRHQLPRSDSNQEHFHHLIRSDKRSTCKVHIQRVGTFYSCAVCAIHMCLEPCFLRYHSFRDYHFNDEDCEGPRRLKEGGGRPRDRGRGRVLQHRTWTDAIMMMEVQLLRQLVIYEKMNVTLSQRQCSKILLLTKSVMPFLYDFKGSYFCAKDCYWHFKWMVVNWLRKSKNSKNILLQDFLS